METITKGEGLLAVAGVEDAGDAVAAARRQVNIVGRETHAKHLGIAGFVTSREHILRRHRSFCHTFLF